MLCWLLQAQQLKLSQPVREGDRKGPLAMGAFVYSLSFSELSPSVPGLPLLSPDSSLKGISIIHRHEYLRTAVNRIPGALTLHKPQSLELK